MSQNRWVVLISLAIIQLFMFGPAVAPIGVYFTPMRKEFNWSHAQVAQLATAVDVSLGICSLLSGWLLDRIDARWVIAVGGAISGAAFLMASHAHSLPILVACYALAGLGVSFAGLVPANVVAVNWFPDRAALAVAISHFGTAMGLSFSPRIIAGVVEYAGWRAGMTTVAVPMLLVVVPMSLIFIRSWPRPAPEAEAPQRSAVRRRAALRSDELALPGLEVSAALATLSFWMLVSVAFLTQFGLGAAYFHTIPYLISVGYPFQLATLIFGIKGFFMGPGGLAWGWVTDRFGPKTALFCGQTLFASSLIMLIIAGNRSLGLAPLITYMLLWGPNTGSSVALPVLLARTQGRRRFGTLNGVLGFAGSVGQGIGPLLAGFVIDATHGYAIAFEMASAIIFTSAVLATMVYPAKGHDRVPMPAMAAAV